jgi:hypothetical protein
VSAYTARLYTGNAFWSVHRTECGEAVGYCPAIGGFSEAEANIIAFALNAVEEGRLLYAVDHGTITGDFHTYDGPTEGVAPHAD